MVCNIGSALGARDMWCMRSEARVRKMANIGWGKYGKYGGANIGNATTIPNALNLEGPGIFDEPGILSAVNGISHGYLHRYFAIFPNSGVLLIMPSKNEKARVLANRTRVSDLPRANPGLRHRVVDTAYPFLDTIERNRGEVG